MKRIKIGLLPRILIAMVLGILVADVIPAFATRMFITFNALFTELLSFIVPLIIVAFVSSAIADIGKGAGRILLVTVGLAYLFSLASGFFSYFTSVAFFPDMIEPSATISDFDTASGPSPYFTISIPPLMNVMTSLVLAFVIGIGTTRIKTDYIRNVFAELKDIVAKTISAVIIPLLPVYIFGIFLNMTSTGQVASVLTVFVKIIGVIFAMHIIVLLFQYMLAALISRKNPFRLLYRMMPAYFTALGTQSSAATIPVTLRQTIANGVSEDTAGFVIPLCATIHLSGSMLKIVACALALMIMKGMPFDFLMVSGFIFLLGVTMIAAPGVPGGAIMASLALLSSSLGFGENELALMIALYATMDSFGTACNVTGDGALALIIDKLHMPASR